MAIVEMLSAEEETALVRRFQSGDNTAGDTLISRHMPLIKSIAKNYMGVARDGDDVIQNGILGFLVAIKKYNPDNEAKARLGTYARRWIACHIADGVIAERATVEITRTTRNKRLFWASLGGLYHDATPDEAEMFSRIHGTITTIEDEDGTATSVLDYIPADTKSPEDLCLSGIQIDKIKHIIDPANGFIDARQRQVIEYRIMTEDPMPLQHIAEQMGLSRERVRQIELRTLDIIRKAVAA